MTASSIDRAKEYMSPVNGRLVPVAEMTLEQLQEALCDAYDFLEEIEDIAFSLNEKIEKWRIG